MLELGLPLVDLGVAGGRLAFFVAVYDARDAELERHPAHRLIELDVPDDTYEARNWTA